MSRAGQGRAGLSRAGQGRAGLSRAGQSRARLSRADKSQGAIDLLPGLCYECLTAVAAIALDPHNTIPHVAHTKVFNCALVVVRGSGALRAAMFCVNSINRFFHDFALV